MSTLPTPPPSGGPLIDLGKLSEPATELVKRVANAVGVLWEPRHIVNVAKAEAEALKIRTEGKIEVADIERRAMYRWIHEEGQRQANIESITQKALPQLAQDSKPREIETDWITNFFEHCRLISDEEMQALWAKVLAGEANKPGSFSKRAVAVLASMDRSEAALFSSLCSFCWSVFDREILQIYDFNSASTTIRVGDIYEKAGLAGLHQLAPLREAGLIGSEGIMFSVSIPESFVVRYFQTPVLIEFTKRTGHWGADPRTFPLGSLVTLTSAGEQLARICDSKPQPEFLEYVIAEWRRLGFKVEVLPAESGQN